MGRESLRPRKPIPSEVREANITNTIYKQSTELSRKFIKSQDLENSLNALMFSPVCLEPKLLKAVQLIYSLSHCSIVQAQYMVINLQEKENAFPLCCILRQPEFH